MIEFAIQSKLATCDKADKIQFINDATTHRILDIGNFLLHNEVRKLL